MFCPFLLFQQLLSAVWNVPRASTQCCHYFTSFRVQHCLSGGWVTLKRARWRQLRCVAYSIALMNRFNKSESATFIWLCSIFCYQRTFLYSLIYIISVILIQILHILLAFPAMPFSYTYWLLRLYILGNFAMLKEWPNLFENSLIITIYPQFSIATLFVTSSASLCLSFKPIFHKTCSVLLRNDLIGYSICMGCSIR